MSNAKICDMCGCVIDDGRKAPADGYTVTLTKVKFFRPEIITVDLCRKCFDSICEINRKKNEEEDELRS